MCPGSILWLTHVTVQTEMTSDEIRNNSPSGLSSDANGSAVIDELSDYQFFLKNPSHGLVS